MTNNEESTNGEELAMPKLQFCVPISSNCTTPPPAPAQPSIRAFSRKNRVYAFRDFLLQTYGTYLAKGSVVLDVAGGKGDLSWLLTNVDELDSVVADPRLTKHEHFVKAIHYLRANPDEAALRAIPNQATHQPLAALLPELKGKECFRSPRHARILVDTHLVDAVRHFLATRDDKAWTEFWINASKRAFHVQEPLGYQKDDATTERQIVDAIQARDLILSLRLIMGFHPDQATEACIDLAILLDIPFCVCPCCVFPSEFPSRKTREGDRVRSYDQFIPYLQNKHKSIRTGTLDFHETKTARNIVLYTLPSE